MVRMLSIYLLILFAGAMTWYVTKQLKEAYDLLKSNGTFSAAKPIFLLVAFLLFAFAGIRSFFEAPEDIASHTLLIFTAILLSLALAINKASLKGLSRTLKRYYFKLKVLIAYRLIKFGKHK